MFNQFEGCLMPNKNNEQSKHQRDAELLETAWEKSQKNLIIEALGRGEKLSDVLNQTPGFKEAFTRPLTCLDCSDGRVCSGGKMGLAGVGILLSPEEKEILQQAVKKLGLEVSGHDNCGAAGLAFPGADSDHYGYENAKILAEATGVTYKEVHEKDFIYPVHNERSLVLESTGRFDCANWKEFPPHFISSAPALGLPDSYIKKEVSVLTGIALGGHGLGERFSAENPFYIIVSANNQDNLNQLVNLVGEAVKEFGDRVKIDGFIAPEKN